MIIDWLTQTTIEVSILIVLVILLRPLVRKFLGAGAAYGLWVVPLFRILLLERPERDLPLLNTLGVEGFTIDMYPSGGEVAIPLNFPWEFLWVAGMLAWATYRVVIFFRFEVALRRSSNNFTLPQDLIVAIHKKMEKTPTNISFLYSTFPGAPFVSGIIKAKIYLPLDFLSRFSTKEQLWIILHEITHVQRKDLWVRYICELVRTLFWFNPLVHFTMHLIHKDQELACDQALLKDCNNEERFQYGKTLITSTDSHSSPSTMTFFNNSKERFIMLAKHKKSRLNTISGIAFCTVLSVFALTKAPTLIADDDSFQIEPITMRFEKLSAGKVISIIAKSSGINVLAPESIREKIITVNLNEIPALMALEMLARCNSHDLDIKDDIIYFVSSDLPIPTYCQNENGVAAISNQ